MTGQSLAARRERLADCVLPVCADMGAAPFAEASFDLVWSEGALYSIGFRNGLDACRRLAIEEKAAVVASAGFDMVGRFTLPPAAWREHYYAPLRERAAALRQAWANDDAGRAVLAQVDTEIAMCERWGHTYGYEFFVARRAAAAS